MRKVAVLAFCILPAVLTAQIELGPFKFLDGSPGYNITLDGVLGRGGLSLAVSAETPAPKFMQFLNFIPGYAMRYLVQVNDGIYGEATVLSRARYQPKRKIIGFVGLGPGLGISTGKKVRVEPTVSVVLGTDILIHEKYLISVAVRSRGLLTIGFGMHKKYGW
ncbi:MAG: hypothetical protein JSU61_06630 [Fidelibacterota bacterium]|nr:MAG: hypothetical protein JSU61_06630 [Candidatus Neomarinimicrobiota bacterium]